MAAVSETKLARTPLSSGNDKKNKEQLLAELQALQDELAKRSSDAEAEVARNLRRPMNHVP
jgi:hypothetical protein